MTTHIYRCADCGAVDELGYPIVGEDYRCVECLARAHIGPRTVRLPAPPTQRDAMTLILLGYLDEQLTSAQSVVRRLLTELRGEDAR